MAEPKTTIQNVGIEAFVDFDNSKQNLLYNLVSNNTRHGLDNETYQVHAGVELTVPQKYHVLTAFACAGDVLCKKVISDMNASDSGQWYLEGNHIAEKMLLRTIGFKEYYTTLYGEQFFG